MNKSYFLAPLAALLVFGAVYRESAKEYDERVNAREAAAEASRQQKQAALDAARRKAADSAATAMQQRRLDRDAREQLEAARKQAVRDAEQNKQNAIDRERALRVQLARVRSDLAVVSADLTQLAARENQLRTEQRFLGDLVRRAEEHQTMAQRLLAQWEQREQERSSAVSQPQPSTRHHNG